MDCSICLEKIKNSCIGSCTHHFCFPCLIKWILHGGLNCPLCKTFIKEIRFDLDFDLLLTKINGEINYPIVPNQISTSSCKHILIKTPNNPLNIIFENNNGPGIKIKDVNKKGLAFLSGLRKRDVILFINNIPAVDHFQSILVVDNCTKSYTTLDFLILN